MDKILYECTHCKARMSAKNRPGSTQFMSMELHTLESFVYTRVEDDPGRPIFSKVYGESDFPRSFRATEEEANFCLTHDYRYGKPEKNYRKEHPEYCYATIDQPQDLVLRISVGEKFKNSDEERTPRDAINSLFKYMEYLKKEGKYEQGLCYLSGGHEWEQIGVIPNG